MHAVEHRLTAPEVIALGDGCLKVDDPHVRPGGVHLYERVSPDVVEAYRPWDRAVSDLGELRVFPRVADIRFIQRRVAGMRQDLINAPSRHHIATEKHAYGVGMVHIPSTVWAITPFFVVHFTFYICHCPLPRNSGNDKCKM